MNYEAFKYSDGTYETKFEPYIICPHCGVANEDSEELCLQEYDIEEIECDMCQKKFWAKKMIMSIDYSTSKDKEDL